MRQPRSLTDHPVAHYLQTTMGMTDSALLSRDELIAQLQDRYPRNPHFPQLIAEINDTYLHDDTASLRAWQAMLSAVACNGWRRRSVEKPMWPPSSSPLPTELPQADCGMIHV